jgi:hypothetical protein
LPFFKIILGKVLVIYNWGLKLLPAGRQVFLI